MANKFSPNNIRDYTDDWGNDSRTNLPYNGKAVQNFLKRELQSKAGAGYFEQKSQTILMFRNADEMNKYINDPSTESYSQYVIGAIPITFSSELYRIKTESNNNGSFTVDSTVNQKSVVLSLNFDVQKKAITDTNWTSTQSNVLYNFYIDGGGSGNYTKINQTPIKVLAGKPVEIDIRQYIQIGQSRVKIELISADDSTVTTNVIYTVNLAEIYIEDFNNAWYNAIVEGKDSSYKLGGFKVVGALNKTIYIDIIKDDTVVKHFEKLIGINSYTDTPYYFTKDDGLDLSGLNTGVYQCKVNVGAGDAMSIPLTYNIMYVAAIDKDTAQLVVVNEDAAQVSNYATSTLCKYAIYNGGDSYGQPHLVIKLWNNTTPTEKANQDLVNVSVGEKHTLDYTIEWLVEESMNLFVSFDLTYGKTQQSKMIAIDNSVVYPAESGYDFYLNPSTRSNNDADREKILNQKSAIPSPITATWSNMSWVNGVDGWTTDDEGRSCLKIPARSSVTIPYSLFNQSGNQSIEIVYKIANVSDYEENAITVGTSMSNDNFTGIRIKPTNITVHSSADITAKNDANRGSNVMDDEFIHFVLTTQNSYGNVDGKNIAIGYINGAKNFEFSYANGISWKMDAPIMIGSSSADVYIYGIREYQKTLGFQSVQQNYVNSLKSLVDRKAQSDAMKSIINESTGEIIYQKVVNSNYNLFVVEPLNDGNIPSLRNGWTKESQAFFNVEMHYGNHPEWDWKIYNVKGSGQGTTSMNYYLWNLRWRIDKSNSDKKCDVAYFDAPTVDANGVKNFNEQEKTLSSDVYFDGGANLSVQKHPKVKRITAKINFASSSQSHKIGATRMFNDVAIQMGLLNEAQQNAKAEKTALPTTAVYEYPAYGFAKFKSASGVYSYEFIGLFTIGPDKGDAPTFGYNRAEIKPELITMEGTDHSRLLAKFCYPWNENVKYHYTNETLNIELGGGDVDNAFEVGNIFGKSTDKATDEASINQILVENFKTAYDVAFNNSTLIAPIALGTYGSTASDTLNWINANYAVFQAKQYNDRWSYADMQFWIEGEYKLYYWDITDKVYKVSAELGTPTGNTLEEQNENYKIARRNNFKENAPKYWDIDNMIYTYIMLLIMGATDNFAKNMYPYLMGKLSEGHKWKFRQDDLDTIFDIYNQGYQGKPYWIEYNDAVNGSTYFAGSSSILWTLLQEVFWDDYGTKKGIESWGRDIMNTLASMGGGANTYEGCLNFFNKYFFDNAQNYFPQSAYNVDAKLKYESAWLADGQAVDALGQSLGNHYLAEKYWVKQRVIYCLSRFKVGPFKSTSDESLGHISLRPLSFPKLDLTCGMWLYPNVSIGSDSPQQTTRTKAGQTKTFTNVNGVGGQDTIYIYATNLLTSVGDWKNVVLSEQYINSINVQGKKLKEFKIGDADASKVTTNIPGLLFPNNEALEKIDARNVKSLDSQLDLTNCKRIKEVLLEGSNIPFVALPDGSKIVTLHYGDNTTNIQLKNLNYLTDIKLPSDLYKVTTLAVENCKNVNGFDLLKKLYDTDNSQLKNIRIINNTTEIVDNDFIKMLINIAENHKKDGETDMNYGGVDTKGNTTESPVINGTVQLQGFAYKNYLDKLGLLDVKDYDSEGNKIGTCAKLGTLYIIYNGETFFIKFDDETVNSIVVTNWGTNGNITELQIKNVKSLDGKFSGNKSIVSFNEFDLFTNVTSVGDNEFADCTSLKSINLPESIASVGNNAFKNDSKLTGITMPESITSVGSYAFSRCTNLSRLNSTTNGEYNLPNCAVNEGTYAFTPAVTVNIPEGVTTIGAASFNGCDDLNSVNIPSTISSIGNSAFMNCTKLDNINYNGTITQWNEITKGVGVFKNDSGDLHITCLDGTIDALKTSAIFTYTDGTTTKVYDSTAITVSDVSNVENVMTAVIKEGVTYVDCFNGAENLLSVTLPSTLTTIGDSGFTNCAKLSEISIPSNVSSIGNYAFKNCSGITSVAIPTNVQAINTSTFENCSQLTAMSISVNIKTIKQGAFNGCTGIKKFTYGGTIEQYRNFTKTESWHNGITIQKVNCTNGNCYFDGTVSFILATLTYKDGSTYNIEGKSSTLRQSDITASTLPSKNDIIKVEIGEDTTIISQSTFEGCSGITSVSLPSTLRTIDYGAFAGCESLTSIYYNGTIDNWNNITIGSNWNYIVHKDFRVICTDGYITTDGIAHQNILNGISIDSVETIEASKYVMKVKYNPKYSTYTGVTWEIVSGSEFASIDESTGLMTIKDNANKNDVTVKATSTHNTEFTAQTTVNVTYLNKFIDVNLNAYGSWVVSDINPDSNTYDSYMSNASKGVNNGYDIMQVTFTGYENFVIYINSYAESNFDYTIASNLDAALPTSEPAYNEYSMGIKDYTRGRQSDPSNGLSAYTKVEYPNDGGTHTIWIAYRKDSSGNSDNDRGYVLLPK